jgi:predicted ATPase
MNITDWQARFHELGLQSRMIGFVIGDTILDCEEELGGAAHQAMLSSGLADSTLLDMARIAARWPAHTRDDSLGYAFYRDAGSDIEVATKLLSSAKKLGWSRADLRQAKRAVESALEEYDGKE